MLPTIASPQIAGTPNPALRLELTHSISDVVYLTEDSDRLLTHDTILNAFAPARPACTATANREKIDPPASFTRRTVHGEVQVYRITLVSYRIA
ncbi:hypothetical protein [Chloroflexus aurantiacus]|jgi:hypothetical protein|uniref:hypothetical protein n=1 Tax=Chloroflexus aurantiacus TaxID=1108 RepID=UPI000315EBC0|nr:hypothetical protein [Chloroflexus aurantiacus]